MDTDLRLMLEENKRVKKKDRVRFSFFFLIFLVELHYQLRFINDPSLCFTIENYTFCFKVSSSISLSFSTVEFFFFFYPNQVLNIVYKGCWVQSSIMRYHIVILLRLLWRKFFDNSGIYIWRIRILWMSDRNFVMLASVIVSWITNVKGKLVLFVFWENYNRNVNYEGILSSIKIYLIQLNYRLKETGARNVRINSYESLLLQWIITKIFVNSSQKMLIIFLFANILRFKKVFENME